MTAIEWTDATWNPIVGCSRVSRGCEHCYAERVAHRGLAPQHKGLTVLGKKGPRWTGEVRFLPERLDEPLRWKRPRRVFVNSMSDLFHEGVSDEQIAAVFGVMAACPQHVFQVLTKRPERAREWFAAMEAKHGTGGTYVEWCVGCVDEVSDDGLARLLHIVAGDWPLPNVWLGVSVEDQATADERIPLLLNTPAAVRWVSYEPALGPADFTRIVSTFDAGATRHVLDALRGRGLWLDGEPGGGSGWGPENRLDWIVIGGESGPDARPFDLAWAHSTVEACRAAGVPCFVKQLGAHA